MPPVQRAALAVATALRTVDASTFMEGWAKVILKNLEESEFVINSKHARLDHDKIPSPTEGVDFLAPSPLERGGEGTSPLELFLQTQI